ncbi:prolyl 4-hydroxylase subunit alpha [Thiosulfatimonas sediminis]|uniref:Prolyl 4-hydroxylase subunit alpha n=1 Tax=Thiosulfatimonas sediminis TaxID=2675054 RepID=A0A6F8PS61_9GAMM|nr:2OG-Fe(II) oxygenase [Thiosulfatimonas sediminis]BBP44955.1 prolyl 4-hydroxylase subunit alpha [Thiosulfatimonas sediminis]
MTLNPDALEHLLDNLVEKGWYEWPQAISSSLCLALLNEVMLAEENGKLKKAGIGRGDEQQLNRDIRRDQIRWLNGESAAQAEFFCIMAALQQEINRALFMGLFEYEAHYALYQPGDFYKKHLDSFQGQANRMVSTVLYLNPDWQAENGGELVIYAKDGQTIEATIIPSIGKLAIFLSEEIPHEVLPTQLPRASIAGWFRCNSSTANLVNPAR